MTTENPMRIVESSGAGKWATSKDAASFASPVSSNIVVDEMGLLLKGHNTRRDQSNTVSNRSGSAPPSMEGSFAAFGNIIRRQGSGSNSSQATSNSALEAFQSEDQLRAVPSYFANYCSNINLNPRLPPPIISRENRHLASHAGASSSDWRLPSLDHISNGSFQVPISSLPIYDKEPADATPSKQSDDWAESSSGMIPGQEAASFTSRNKNHADLIQEDFLHTPSPVYSHSHSSSHVTTEETADHHVEAHLFEKLALNVSKLPESKSGSSHSELASPSGSTAIRDPSPHALPKLDTLERSSSPYNDDLTGKDVGSGNDFISGASGSHASGNLLKVVQSRNNQEEIFCGMNVSNLQNTYQQHHNQFHQIPGSQVQIASGGVNNIQNEMQPLVHSPGLAHPLYATAAAYMGPANPFYPNLTPSGLYASQYSGYALGSSFLPQFVAGYPTHSGLSIPFNASSGQSYGGQNAVLTGESIPKGGNMQNIDKFYGQHGLAMHPSFPDPLPVQYFQHPLEDAYGAPLQFGRLSSPGMIRGQADYFASQKDPSVAAYTGDQNFQSRQIGSLSIPSPRNMGAAGSSYFRSPTGLGFMPQFPASPLGSPVLPGTPIGRANSYRRKNENRVFQGSVRNVGAYAGWQGKTQSNSFNDPSKHSFLEELKAGSTRRIDLSEITGFIVEFSVDQHGSRFIQQKMQNCSGEEKESVFREILPHSSKLMTDVFGNYVIQKFFEHGSYDQRRELASQLSGLMLHLSLQMYGCRVIQKALEVIELEQKTELVHELDGHVTQCVRDQNGNHVIQKCIECIPTEKIVFIISAFHGQAATLSTHPYGCRVIQRVLEHCPNELHSQGMVDEILESACDLAQDQYGNYVIQHVLERGKSLERSRLIGKLSGKIVQMSQHKYASNVVEKCLEYGDATERELLIEEILGQSEDNDNMLVMMKDQYANYVVQKILEISNDYHRELLLNRIRVHHHSLKNYTYGKHIVARFEQLYGEESGTCELP